MNKTTDVCSLHGKTFAAYFYAGYHGNAEAPVSDPSPTDTALAEMFVQRLLLVQPDADLVPTLGRQFGAFVAHRHSQTKQSFPALQPAIRQYGDEFYTRLKASVETDRRKALDDARKVHFSGFRPAHTKYLLNALKQHEAENSQLYQQFLAEEEESLKSIRTNRFGLDTENLVRMHQSEAARLERFERFLSLSETTNDVLDFWDWDQNINPESFNEEKL